MQNPAGEESDDREDTVMLDREQIVRAKGCMSCVTNVTLPWDVTVLPGTDDEVRVTIGERTAEIAAGSVNGLTRGFFMLARAAKENWPKGTVTNRRRFASCGAMIDCSRNAVMKVEAVKRYIDQLACLGMNLLMLYTEDTFEVPEYPAFGYLRGGYSQKDLREIDDYAASMGVELVPCIQTLAHLSQFLQWQEAAHLKDLPDVLMIDEPETYAFIEAEIRSVSSCVRSRRIHIGMDEAHGVGLGRYYAKHGPTDRFELLSRHVGRVSDICRKYGLEPMMWSDMFFRLGSAKNDYYDQEALVPQSVIDALPPIGMVYWDYYHKDEAFYDHMLTQHARMGQKTVFAGGIWTWAGFLPQVKRTEATMYPALRACARHGVDTVIATMWGDDGAETNTMLASSLLPIFSEACWQGAGVDAQEAVRAGECLTGVPRAVLHAWGELFPGERDQRPGKFLLYCDPLYPTVLFGEGDDMDKLIARSERAIAAMKPYRDAMPECRYASLLFETLIAKGGMVRELRARYLAGDRAWLTAQAEETIPALLALYDALMRAHRALWERDNRRFGWEVLALRYGAITGRLADVQDELRRYLAGELHAVVELDAEPRGFKKGGNFHCYGTFVTPARDIWA